MRHKTEIDANSVQLVIIVHVLVVSTADILDLLLVAVPERVTLVTKKATTLTYIWAT